MQASTVTYFSDSSTYWNRVYDSRTVKGQVYRHRMDVVLRWATTVAGPGAVAADIGTGAGHLAVALAGRGLRVAAIDASQPMLAQVIENAARAGVADRIVPIGSDADRLELASATCDVSVAIGLLPWVARPERAMREIARITKPGGYVIVTMDNVRSLARGLDPGWHASARSVIDAIRRRIAPSSEEAPSACWPAMARLGEVDQLLRSAGLLPLRFTGVGFGPFTFLGRNLLPNRIGLQVERLLQWLADHQAPLLRRAAVFHIALAHKPIQRAAPTGEKTDAL